MQKVQYSSHKSTETKMKNITCGIRKIIKLTFTWNIVFDSTVKELENSFIPNAQPSFVSNPVQPNGFWRKQNQWNNLLIKPILIFGVPAVRGYSSENFSLALINPSKSPTDFSAST